MVVLKTYKCHSKGSKPHLKKKKEPSVNIFILAANYHFL